MSREAMKLALEALEYIHEGANNQGPHTGISWRCVSKKAAPAITALRQALANEALDKKAENARELGLDYEPAQDSGIVTAGGFDPRTQRTWVGLTDEEVSKIIDDEIGFNSCWGPEEQFARAIEAKLREKNNG